MHTVNTFFGHLHLLARYAGEEDRLVLGYLQHGWDETNPMPEAPHLRWIPMLMWNERNAAAVREKFGARTALIGAPFLYLEGGHAPPLPPPEQLGDTIVYPYHRWDYDTSVDADGVDMRAGPALDDTYHRHHAQFAEEIRRREDGVVTVVLYWRDFQEAAVRAAYEAQGFRVTCHGERYDSDFLERQRRELVGHRRSITNRLGTASFYAAYCGLELEVYGPFSGASRAEAAWFEASQRARYPQLFDGGIGAEEARALGEAELGLPWQREPDELAELLGWRGWRRTATPVAELVDRLHHRLRWQAHLRDAPPPPWSPRRDAG